MYHVISKVNYETNYTLNIHGVNANNNLIEGNKSSYEFTTPTCLYIYGPNLTKCRKSHVFVGKLNQFNIHNVILISVWFSGPIRLKNVNSTYNLIEPGVYQVNVTWDMPKYHPKYYNVSLNMNSEGSMAWQNVSGVGFFLLYNSSNKRKPNIYSITWKFVYLFSFQLQRNEDDWSCSLLKSKHIRH